MLYYKVILILVYFALLLPALPPVFLPLFEPYTFGKTVLFEIAAELMLLLLLFGVRLRTIPWSNIAKPIILLSIAFSLSMALGAHPLEGLWGSSARMDGLFTLLHFVVFFFVLATAIKGEREWRNMMRWSVGASVFVVLYGLAQWFELPFVVSSNGEIFSTLGNPAYLATYLLFHVFISLYLMRGAASKEARAWYAIAAMLAAIVVVLTQVSAALAGLAAGLCVAAYPYCRVRIASVHAFAAIGIALTIIPLFFANPHFEKLAPFGGANALAIETRLRAWNIAAQATLAHPLFGHGPNQFERTFLNYKSKGYAVPDTGETFDKPHNAFLEIAFSYGLLGLAAYLYLLWVVFSRIGKISDTKERWTFRGALVSYLVSIFFLFDTFSSLLMFFFLLAFLASPPPVGFPPPHPKTRIYGFLGGALFTVFFFMFHFAPLYSAYFAHQFFARATETGKTDHTLKNRALQYDSFNRPFIERAIYITEQNLKK
ncbi:O-antigen ligase family protein [Candidatus Azambacteria bacterium]|nr:O-antigen ligase family protein [Candidatus Azambacteria bacterium]MBI3684988.1 O-antigen ligase family protein [Candidatus Azambacteria bacterium]